MSSDSHSAALLISVRAILPHCGLLLNLLLVTANRSRVEAMLATRHQPYYCGYGFLTTRPHRGRTRLEIDGNHLKQLLFLDSKLRMNAFLKTVYELPHL